MSWIMDENSYPTNTDFIAIPEKALVQPYPHALWRITEGVNDGLPYNGLMLVEEAHGAFMNAEALRQVRIPASVKSIGRWAFAGTELTSVRIAKDCEYFPSSFPDGCEVTYYTSDGSYSGDYGQLLDSEGKTVLDSSGARVYVKE